MNGTNGELMYHRDDRAFHSKNNSVHRLCVLCSSCSCSVCSVGIEDPPDFRLAGQCRKARNTYYLILSKVSMISDMYTSVVIALISIQIEKCSFAPLHLPVC